MQLAQYFTIFRKLRNVNFLKTSQKIMLTDDLCCEVKSIFKTSVQSIQTDELIRKSIYVHSNSVEIQGRYFPINKNVYIVGFGKAVIGMAIALENMLQNHLVSGILSVPVGVLKSEILVKNRFLTKMEIFEGARDNIPDKDSFLAAQKIAELVASLHKSSLLLVLISGGGSALLPYPRSPLIVEEKQNVIKILMSKGATIEEINVIRKRLSTLKGGGLAKLAKSAQVISLILSDIIGDPLSLIASGPTVENTDDPSLPLSIIEKYNVKDILPSNAKKLLEDISESKSNNENFQNVNNFIIGNNTIALQAAFDKAKELQYEPIIMTNKLRGIASDVGCKIIKLIDAALQQNYNQVMEISKMLDIENEKMSNLLNRTKVFEIQYKGFCMLFGGETTVTLKGKGIGGRNQELALAASLELCKKKSKNEIILLSAGTDGIDGPTDAAGAIATSFIGNCEELDAASYLTNNDSYSFYHLLRNGQYHIKIGHTGTNVMDIIIVLIKRDY